LHYYLHVQLPSISFVVLDTETTGFVPRANRVIEFASVRIEGGKVVSEFEQLFSIPTNIPEPVQVLTRIRPADVEGKPLLEDLRETILEQIPEDTIIVGQNIPFDLRMLKGEGIDLTDRPCIDTSMLASLVFPELKSYSLGYVSTVLKLEHEPVHRALGDVYATLALLSRCWERLLELSPELHEVAQHVMGKSSPGYQRLFKALPSATATGTPGWLATPATQASGEGEETKLTKDIFKKPEKGSVHLVEEPLNPTTLQQLLNQAIEDPKTVHWITVKNLDAALNRLHIPEGVRVIHPPWHLLDLEAATSFAQQKSYTADEGTLALKLAWYEPQCTKEFPMHGEEHAVWNGRLACTDFSQQYTAQFNHLPSVVLLDHQQLLAFLHNTEHIAHSTLDDHTHIIIDDASMLEDTATKAYGWHCCLDDIRAAAEGDASLTSFVDILQIWIEKRREGQDQYDLDASHLQTQEARGVRERSETLLESGALPPLVKQQLIDLLHILDPQQTRGRISWIEQRQDGSQYLHSVPDRIDILLKELLFNQFSTTLLIPPGSQDTLPFILPQETPLSSLPLEESVKHILPLSIEPERTVESILEHPPKGKTIVLLPSRRLIEGFFISATERLEEQGVTLICQNLSGGQQRLQAEFLAAEAPCVWLLTPWSYEGVELPPNTVDALFLSSLPFDIPSNPTFSRRAERFSNAFEEYALPRLEHRLFRLLRTFCRHRTPEGTVSVLDERLTKKSYGSRLQHYVEQFGEDGQEEEEPAQKRRGKEKIAPEEHPSAGAAPDKTPTKKINEKPKSKPTSQSKPNPKKKTKQKKSPKKKSIPTNQLTLF